jgi:usherin
MYVLYVCVVRYNISVKACTVGGCSESARVNITTKIAAPTNMPAPSITALSESQLYINWQFPLNPNGAV